MFLTVGTESAKRVDKKKNLEPKASGQRAFFIAQVMVRKGERQLAASKGS